MRCLGRMAVITACLLALTSIANTARENAWAGLGSLYADCWFSPKSGKLTVKTKNSEQATVRRRGKQIAVLALAPTRCKGGRPTVRNTDRIGFLVRGPGITEGHLSLLGGPFAPGATPEADGTSEIEVSVNVVKPSGTFHLDGSEGPEDLRGGTVGGVQGINLNPAADGPAPDADLTLRGRGGNSIWLALKGGDDIVTLNGGPEFRGGFTVAAVVAQLGAGNDRFVGSAGSDLVIAGPGLDVVSTGSNDDAINSQDGLAEAVDCGDGHDRIQPDPTDVYVSCEELGFVGFAD